jgi:uncharacterized YccA/Bax inhibitor family protein
MGIQSLGSPPTPTGPGPMLLTENTPVASIGNLQTGNPAFTLGGSVFDDWAATERRATTMTVAGTAAKALGLLIVLGVCAAVAWTQVLRGQFSYGWMIGAAIAGMIVGFVTIFVPKWAPITAPIYSACQGYFLGAISSVINQRYPGIASQAVLATVATALAMLFLYATRIVRVTDAFMRIVVGCTGALVLLYISSWILRLFGVNVSFLYDSSPLSIGISAVAIGLAALNLLLDFDFIEQKSREGAPKSLEWYGAFGLMVTLIWLYLEILRLLAKLQDRR